ncbi:FAD-binding oxidoreductase [Streptomyces sp. Tue6028]|uniref:FAD-binding oxidoreductase n=1 Tax=Streptomyces sp. Tue6028 TaxID=2036037 RepID=UPI003EB727FE
MTLRKLTFWSAAIVFPLPLILTYDSVATAPGPLKFYIFLGLIAYTWWLLSIVLSVRSAWLHRFVGLPSIYGLHGMLGVLAVGAAYLHREYSYSPSQLARDLGDWGFYVALAVLCFSVFFMSGWLVDRSRLLQSVKQLLEVAVRHQISLWIHRLNLVVVAMIWLHAHLLVRVNQYFSFMVLFDLYTLMAFGVYVWKKWIAPETYVAGAVTSNDACGEATRRISVGLDSKAENIQPGDFFFLSFEGAASVGREWHPFSVTDDDKKTVTFTIRQHGDFTRRLGGVEVGDRVRLEGPFGRFESIIQGSDDETPLVLIGMGAGVAPLLSLAAAHHKTREIHLLWIVRTPEDAYYRDVIEEYRTASDGRMQVTINVGRLRREDFTSTVSAEQLAKSAFFVVGPNPAVLANQRLLRRLGVSARRIHQERLTM